MKGDTFQWSFIGVTLLAVVLIVLAIVGVISTWVIAIAVVGGIAGNGALLYYLGKDYMGCYREKIGNIEQKDGI